MNNFDDHINRYLHQHIFEEVDNKYKLGIFIGKFKPPHAGHYNTLMGVLGDGSDVFSTRYPQDIPDCACDEAIVIISDKAKVEDLNRDGRMIEVTADVSKQLWELYVENTSGADKVEFKIGSPVLGAIEVVEQIRENGGYKGIPVEDIHIRLFVGEEEDDEGEISVAGTEKEMKRYNYIIKNQDKLLGGEDKIKVCVMARSTSATEVREKIARIALDNEDLETIKNNIPSHVDLGRFWDIAKQVVI